MTYAAGTFGTTGPTRALWRAVLDSTLTAGGWVAVGNYTDPNAYTDVSDFYRVYRLPKATSGQSTDLYFTTWHDAPAGTAAGYADATTDINVYCTITEDFNTTSRLVSKAVPPIYYSGAQTTADGHYPGFGASGVTPRSVVTRYLTISPGSQYWISVTSSRIAITTRSSQATFTHLYAGFVDTFMPSTIPNLGGAFLGGLVDQQGPTNQIAGGWTREPGQQQTTDVYNIFGGATYALFPAYYDPYYYNGYHVLPVVAYHYRNGQRVARGYLQGIYAAGDNGSVKQAGFVPGDTITVGSKTYVAMNQVSYTGATYLVDTSL